MPPNRSGNENTACAPASAAPEAKAIHRPAGGAGNGLGDGAPRRVGIHRRPLAERELKILKTVGQLVDDESTDAMPSVITIRLAPDTPSSSTHARQRSRAGSGPLTAPRDAATR